MIRTLATLNKDDLTTTYGRNLYNIGRCCNLPVNCLTPQLVKGNMTYFTIPEAELWRIAIIEDILALRNNEMSLTGFSYVELKDILDHVCTT